jgi:hypothetical protein
MVSPSVGKALRGIVHLLGVEEWFLRWVFSLWWCAWSMVIEVGGRSVGSPVWFLGFVGDEFRDKPARVEI